MRDARGQGDRVQIDLIDVDPEVFDADGTGSHTRSRSRQVLKAVGMVVVIAVAGVVWWPRSHPPAWSVFHPAVVPAAGLTDQLVFDVPPGEISETELAPEPVDAKPELGYVFGVPGGTFLTSRWASFRTHWTGHADAPAATDGPIVGGVSANVRRIRVRHFVEWGPLDGREWTVTTNRFKEAEALDFANHVAIIDERPALANRYDLGDMKPVGSIAAFDCVHMLTSLFDGTRVLGPVMPTVVRWQSPLYKTALGSIAAPSDVLPLVEFVLGDGRPATVHGQPALIIDSNQLGPVIAWLEDGRLIIVQGDRPDAELTALAESVRPATDGEWRRIGLSNIRETNGVSFNLADSTTLYDQTNAVTGDELVVSVQVVDDQFAICVQQRNNGDRSHCEFRSSDLPLLTTVEANGKKYVIAIVSRSVSKEPELRIKLGEGTWTLPLQDFGSAVPGLAIATQLPDDYGVIELWNNGEVDAAI